MFLSCSKKEEENTFIVRENTSFTFQGNRPANVRLNIIDTIKDAQTRKEILAETSIDKVKNVILRDMALTIPQTNQNADKDFTFLSNISFFLTSENKKLQLEIAKLDNAATNRFTLVPVPTSNNVANFVTNKEYILKVSYITNNTLTEDVPVKVNFEYDVLADK